MVTTHRILFYKGAHDCLEIPLWYICKPKKTGSGVMLINYNKSGHPEYVVDYFYNILKKRPIQGQPPKVAGS
jgi:hypothetical protein